MTRVVIDVDAIGCGTIIVDGVDLSQKVRGFTLRARVGQPTLIRLDYNAVMAEVDAETE